MTFGEVPEIETILIDRKDSPVLGAGEATQGPTAAAISNAVFDAVGIRLRRIPFTPEMVLEAAVKA
jgi:CO/xanthine dehydrogenase Mo-binding subunit